MGRGILLYDAARRWVHGLDDPRAHVGPALSIELRRLRWRRDLPDGTRLRRGDRVGILHLRNNWLPAIRTDGLAPLGVGLEFRRTFLASLRALARRAAPAGPLADVRAFTAVTVDLRGLARLGFQAEPDNLIFSRVIAAYHEALCASLWPERARRRARKTRGARRFWITRETLRARYNAGSKAERPAATSGPSVAGAQSV